MKGGYLVHDSTLKEGYGSTSDQDDEIEVNMPRKRAPSEIIRCSGCNYLFRNQNEFMNHIKDDQYCWREKNKLHKEMDNKKNGKSGGAGSSVEPKPLRLFNDPLELTLAPPGPPPPAPLSLNLTLATGKGAGGSEGRVGLGDGKADLKKFKM